ncbi:hypothetical protein ACRAWG_20860 [Methylobacterium sp. P31]
MAKRATSDACTAAQSVIGAGPEAALKGRRKACFVSLGEALTGLAGNVGGSDPGRSAKDEAFAYAVAVVSPRDEGRDAGAVPLRQVAALNVRRISTALGRAWTPTQVRRV